MIDLTTRANPVFIRGNYLNNFADTAGDLVLSHSNALRARLYDMRPKSFVEFAGSEAADAIITFGVHDEGDQVFRLADIFVMQGHNCADILLEMSVDDGSTYPASESVSNLSTSNKVISFASAVLVNKAKITCTATQSAGLAKQIGNIILGTVLLQPTKGILPYSPSPFQNVLTARMGDGTPRRAPTWFAANSYTLWDHAITFVGLTDAELDQFESLFLNMTEPIIFMPFPGRRPQDAYLVHVLPSTWRKTPMSINMDAGWMLQFTLQDFGGA